MTIKPSSNIHGKTGGGKIYYDRRFGKIYEISKRIDISDEAKKKLKWFDYYEKKKNAALTCRYFGISESCFWKWKKRYEKQGLFGLESLSKKPKNVRKPDASPEIISKIDKLRRIYPYYGKDKIKELLKENISESSIGRIINRYDMYYRKKKKKSYHSLKWGKKQRIKDLKLYGKPGEHIQMDTIIFHRYGKTYYIKTAIDTVTKITFAYAFSRNTSATTVDFLNKLQFLLPYPVKNIHTDNGSEFLGKFEEELKRKNIKHYFSYPKCPKQHGTVERFNRTLQEEFLNNGNFHNEISILNQALIQWLIEYNFHRPHASLGYQNPLAFYEHNFVQSNPVKPSSIYWTHTES